MKRAQNFSTLPAVQSPHLNPLPEGEEDAKRPVRAARERRLNVPFLKLALVCAIALVSCESFTHAPPPVTAEMTKVRRENGDTSPASRISLAKLQEGRAFFVSRCIECHTLPPVWHYTNKDWPRLVDTMAHRAHLKPNERDAVVAYILAARAL